MKNLTTLLIALFVFINPSNSQSFDWAKASGGEGSDQAYAIVTDTIGNSYVTGWFSNSAHFGDITLTSENGKDVFLAKYNNDGEVVWAVAAHGIANNAAAGITLDWDGFPIITGWFAETIHFGETPLESNGSYDMFVTRYNSSGDVIWAKSAGGEGDDYGNRLTTNFEYDVIVSGSFRYTANFGENTSITSEGNRDIFIANYANNGNFQWVKKAGGEGEDRAYDILCAPDGGTYFTGVFNGKAFFGEHDIVSNSFLSTFITKMDAGGNFLWVRKGTGGANDYARGFGISMDGEGYAYAVGTFSGMLTFGDEIATASGGEFDFDTYIVKYNSQGDLSWLKNAGGYGMDKAFDLYTDNNGNSFVTGFFSGEAEFGGHVLESEGKADIFIAKYNWAGEVIWAKRAGGEYLDYGYSISNGNPENGILYICGNYQEDATFDDIVLTNWGGVDMFVAKLNHDNDFVNESTNKIINTFPNPSNGTFIINLEESTNKDITIKIYSTDGKLVIEKHISNVKHSTEIKTDLTSGVYNLHIPELSLNSKLIIK